MNAIKKKYYELKKSISFLSEDEIVEYLTLLLDDKSIKNMRNMPREDLISMHFSVGMTIRNEFSLWHEKNPHTVLDDPSSDNFPDQMSHRILERIYDEVSSTKYKGVDG